MKRLFVIIVVAVLALAVGCRKKELVELDSTRVVVTAYWDLAEMRPQNATMLIYDADGKLYQESRVASGEKFAQFKVNLPIGRYTLVVFNELRDQIDKVGIRGWQNFETLEAYSLPNDKPIYTFEKGTNLTYQPGILATANCTLDVTADVVARTYSADNRTEVELHPDRKTAQSNIIIDVLGLSNARMPAATQLRNMAEGYFFATDRNSMIPVSVQFPTSNRQYFTGSKTDGTISTSITTFGVLGEWHHTADTPDTKVYLDIAFVLNDSQRTVFEVEEDVTDMLEIEVNTKLQVTLSITVQTPPLPNVTPGNGGSNNGSGSGFDAELADWDNIVIPLPTI